MRLIINGQAMDVNIRTIVDLLTHLKLKSEQTAVEKNGIIIDKSAYETEQVTEGDHLELIRFMGGGAY